MTIRTALSPPGNEGILPSAIRCRPAILPAVIAALTSLLLISCTGTGEERSAASAPSRFARFPHSAASSDCFYQRRIDNFEVLNDSNLFVMEGRRRVYHLEVSPPSFDLRHAFRLEFESTTGRVCGNPGDRLKVSNGSFSSFPLSVIGVYRLDETTQAAVRAHFGQTTPLPVPPENKEAEAIEELITDLEKAESEAGEESVTEPAVEDQEN